MRLSFETARQRWTVMVAVWLIGGLLLVLHARAMKDYITIADQLGLRGAPTETTPLKEAYPAFAADAQTWVRHALSLLEGHDTRLRYTYIDNAPDGREVHWNSAWAWTIALAGEFNHWVTGTPLPQSVEQMTLWLAPFALFVLTVVLSSWVARRAGTIAGVVVAFAMVGHPRIYEGFFPTYVDHHGLLTIAVMGMVIGATLMGAGWWRERPADQPGLYPVSPAAARRAAAASAFSGALGLWVSAASVIPPIVIVGVSAVIVLLLQGRHAQRSGLKFDPGAWRTWGWVGAAWSVFFYLLEYFPSRLGFRLEANHPFHALAWLGGGELIALFGEAWLAEPANRWRGWPRAIPAVMAVLVSPVTILIGGAQVFSLLDPFMANLHRTYIQEFQPLWLVLRGSGWSAIYTIVGLENVALLVGVGCVLIRRRHSPVVVTFITLATVIFTAMAWWESRWLLNASGSQVCLALVLLVLFLADRKAPVRWGMSVLAGGLLFLPSAITRVVDTRADVTARRIGPKDANSMLFRDVAVALRDSQPQGEIVVLASPNASTGVGYYGRFKTLGTLYWENAAGLKAAAAIFSARNLDEAATLIRQHHVTHIAMISEENFVEQYFHLLHPNEPLEEVKKCFGYQLLYARVIPSWLQMIPYQVPEDLRALKNTILLFKVAFDQTPADALYNIALAKVAMGDSEGAERDFDTLIKGSPQSFQPWLRKGELLFARHDWKGAADFTVTGIQRAPAEERINLYANAASSFYRARQPAQAIQLYRAALRERFEPQIAAYLAFVLASSKDDSLRNGREALELANKAVEANTNSPTVLNSLAAALAEEGHFDEALKVADRALGAARQLGDKAAENVTIERLKLFQAHKPVRE